MSGVRDVPADVDEGVVTLAMLERRRAIALRERAERDAAYRRALGLPPGAPLPKTLGHATGMGHKFGGLR